MKHLFYILICFFFITGCAMSQKTTAVEGMPSGAPVERILIKGDKCAWSPDLIKVTKGTHLFLDIESVDWDYNFRMSGYNLRFAVAKGEKVTAEIYASEKGEFEFGCYIQEGENFVWGGMVGKLIVQ